MNHLRTLSVAAVVSAVVLQIVLTQSHSYPSVVAAAEESTVSGNGVAVSTPVNTQSVAAMPATPLPLVIDQPQSVEYSNIPLSMIDAAKPVDRVAAMISSNEGSPTSIDWNDNGQGVSVGMFQANQRVGELPQLLQTLSNDPVGKQALLNAFGTRIVTLLSEDPSVIQKLDIKKSNWLGRGLQQLVQSQSFQKLQVHVLRQKVVKAAQIAKENGIRSSAGVAIYADLTNQWGEGGAKRFLKAASNQSTEYTKLKAIVDAVKNGSPYGSRYQEDLHKAQANGLDFASDFGA